MTKKTVKTPLPVIKKENRWYNTLTKKYVSEGYAKRLNAYFLKHPEKTLVEARGHGVYDKDKSLTEHSKEIREMLYTKGTQTIRTTTLKGKKVRFSPVQDAVLDEDILKHLKKLDYRKGNIDVELYRLTRSKENIYHIFSVNVQQRLTTPSMVDFWIPEAWHIYNSLMKELLKIHKKHTLGKDTLMYGHISNYFYSDLDGWEKGTSIGFVVPDRSGIRYMKDQFRNILNWYRNKLEGDTYHNIMVQRITFYLYGYRTSATELQKQISNYRIGVTHIPYAESKKEKLQRKKRIELKKKRSL